MKCRMRSAPKKPPVFMARNNWRSTAMKSFERWRVCSSRRGNKLSGSRPTSSANRQKSRRIRKWATPGYLRRTCAGCPPVWKTARRFLGDAFDRLARFEFVRVKKYRPQRFQSFCGEQVIQRQGDRAGGQVGVIGADDDGVDIRNDQQRRVFEGFAVAQELFVGLVQVEVAVILALVFPAEIAQLGHICPALSAAAFGCAHLEGKACAGWVIFNRRWMPDQVAKIEEMFLHGLLFSGSGTFPLADKILRSKGHWEIPIGLVVLD